MEVSATATFFGFKLATLHLLKICSQNVYNGTFFIQYRSFSVYLASQMVLIENADPFRFFSSSSICRLAKLNAFIDSLYLALCFL